MTIRLATSLVSDLIDQDLEMLHSHEEAPKAATLLFHTDPVTEVTEGQKRLQEALERCCGQDMVYVKQMKIVPLLGPGNLVLLKPTTLVVVLHYPTEHQRVLELTLSEKAAKLHFLK